MKLKYIVTFFIIFSSLSTKSFTEEKEKVVIVTGASKGAGLAMAKYLASQGYIVYGTVRPSSNSSALDQACNDHLYKLVTSLSSEAEINQAFDCIVKKHGAIDVVINNAAYVLIGTVESCTIEEQKELFDVNYFGPVRVIQAVLPHMREQKRGKIINIGSVSGMAPFSPWENYSAAKFALRGLSESMAASLSPWNIKVSLIEPSSMKTNASQHIVGSRNVQDPDPYQAIRNYQGENEGFDPIELGKLVKTIIETTSPHVRYQIGVFAQDLAQKVYVDPSGDEVTRSSIEYYKGVGYFP